MRLVNLDGQLKTQRRRLLREVNLRIEEAGGRLDQGGLLTLMCECGQEGCHSTVELDHAERKRVLADDGLWVVAPGHAVAH